MIKRLIIPTFLISLVLFVSGCINSSPSISPSVVSQYLVFLFIVFIGIAILAVILLIYAPRLCGALLFITGLFLTLTIFLAAIGIPLMLIGVILIAVGGKKETKINVTQHVNQNVKYGKNDEEHEKGEIAKSEEKSKKGEEEHMKILKQRYARGEITKKEFEMMKKDLES